MAPVAVRTAPAPSRVVHISGVNPELHEQMNALARANYTSFSAETRRAMAEHIKRELARGISAA